MVKSAASRTDSSSITGPITVQPGFAHYGASIDLSGESIALTKGNSRSWHATFAFRRPAAGSLILDGDMDQYRIHVELQLVEFDSFRLLNSGFRWIRPPDPYGG